MLNPILKEIENLRLLEKSYKAIKFTLEKINNTIDNEAKYFLSTSEVLDFFKFKVNLFLKLEAHKQLSFPLNFTFLDAHEIHIKSNIPERESPQQRRKRALGEIEVSCKILDEWNSLYSKVHVRKQQVRQRQEYWLLCQNQSENPEEEAKRAAIELENDKRELEETRQKKANLRTQAKKALTELEERQLIDDQAKAQHLAKYYEQHRT